MRISDWSSDVCSSDLGARCWIAWPRCEGRRGRRPDTAEFRRSGLRPRRLLIFAATVGETHPHPTLTLKGRAQTRGLRPRRLLLNYADASVPVSAPPADGTSEAGRVGQEGVGTVIPRGSTVQTKKKKT